MAEVEEGILWIWGKREQIAYSSVLYEWKDEAIILTTQ